MPKPSGSISGTHLRHVEFSLIYKMSSSPTPTEATLEEKYSQLVDAQQVRYSSRRQLIRPLGSGGQGIVYLSFRSGMEGFSLPVALKLFSPKPYDSDRIYRREMSRMARVALHVAQVQQDNLVDVHDFLNNDGIHLMEMEWIDGMDLRRLLRKDAFQHVREQVTARRWEDINQVVITEGHQQPRLKPGIAIAILRECLIGLDALHRVGIVHCDMKPGNIMLKRSGNVKVIDIGSAFEKEDPPDRMPCTPQYAALEVLLGEVATPQSDLASLGYVLLEMLSGTHPFAGVNYSDAVNARRNAIDLLPALLPREEFAFSDLLIPLIQRLIDPDPSKRFASAEDANLGEHGAADFERELVKGDFNCEYEIEIRSWIAQFEDVLPDEPDLATSTKTFARNPQKT
jgi:eukaryotic-like serine/threonine-protein kinase